MKNGIGEHYATLITRCVGELIFSSNISCGINMLLSRPQSLVNLDAFSTELYAQTFQA